MKIAIFIIRVIGLAFLFHVDWKIAIGVSLVGLSLSWETTDKIESSKLSLTSEAS